MRQRGSQLFQGRVSLLEQIRLVAAQMIRTSLSGTAEVFCEPFDETQIAPDRPGAVVAALEFFEHDFAKVSHSGLPSVTNTLSRSQNLIDRHCRSDRGACGFVLTAQPAVTTCALLHTPAARSRERPRIELNRVHYE